MKEKGFTLIELMVVIVIIGILVAIALPNFIGAQDRAKEANVKSNAHTVQIAAEAYAVDQAGFYPGDCTSTTPPVATEITSVDVYKDYQPL